MLPLIPLGDLDVPMSAKEMRQEGPTASGRMWTNNSHTRDTSCLVFSIPERSSRRGILFLGQLFFGKISGFMKNEHDPTWALQWMSCRCFLQQGIMFKFRIIFLEEYRKIRTIHVATNGSMFCYTNLVAMLFSKESSPDRGRRPCHKNRSRKPAKKRRKMS